MIEREGCGKIGGSESQICDRSDQWSWYMIKSMILKGF